MDWSIVIHDEGRYAEVITSGLADKDGSLDMARAISQTMRTHRITKVLIDHRNVDRVTGNTFEIYDRPKIFPLLGVILRIKIAEIIRPEHLEHFKFLETVCRNRGYKVAVFQNKDKALAWLLG
jgi:hypothetical protein